MVHGKLFQQDIKEISGEVFIFFYYFSHTTNEELKIYCIHNVVSRGNYHLGSHTFLTDSLVNQ